MALENVPMTAVDASSQAGAGAENATAAPDPMEGKVLDRFSYDVARE